MRVLTAVVVVMVSALACSTTGDELTSTSTPQPTLAVSGCPADDEAFCATATEVANALVAGNTDELVELSRADSVNCVDVAQEYFPQCQADDLLNGHGLSDADLSVELVSADAYRDQLQAIADRIDPTFADEIGQGGMRVLGIGTCGPDVPGRRTYHLAWTAALADADDTARRVLGSLELAFDIDWRVVLMYVDTLARWRAEQANPLDDAFCAAGRTPWA